MTITVEHLRSQYRDVKTGSPASIENPNS